METTSLSAFQTRFSNAPLSRVGGVLTLALVAFGLAGCGGPQKYVMQGTGNAVGADARLVADIREETANTALNLEVRHLPPPERLDPGATSYVVWQRGSTSVPWSRVGVLAYDAEERKGALEKVTVPVTAFDLQVTAEADPSSAAPSTVVVFSQRVQKS